MKDHTYLAPLIAALVIASTLVVLAILRAPMAFEDDLNDQYKESIAIKTRAFKTEVWVDGKMRPDCKLQRGAGTLNCSKTRLSPEE